VVGADDEGRLRVRDVALLPRVVGRVHCSRSVLITKHKTHKNDAWLSIVAPGGTYSLIKSRLRP
jgi:hypothetical protein